MDNCVITYKPYKRYIYLIPFLVLLEILVYISGYELCVYNTEEKLHFHCIIMMFGVFVLVRCCYLIRIKLEFYEDKILIKNVYRNKYIEKKYSEIMYTYSRKSYRHQKYWIFSNEVLTEKELSVVINRNEYFEQVIVRELLIIRINPWFKDSKILEDFIRRKAVSVDEKC